MDYQYSINVLKNEIEHLIQLDVEVLNIKLNDHKKYLEYQNFYDNNMEERIYLVEELKKAIKILENGSI